MNKDALRGGLAITVPLALMAGTIPVLMVSTEGDVPTLAEFAGWVGVMTAALLAAGTAIPIVLSTDDEEDWR